MKYYRHSKMVIAGRFPLILVRALSPVAVVALLFAASTQTMAQTGLGNQWIAFNRAGGPDSQLQCYTPNNVAVSGGNLLITSKVETATCSSFDLPLAMRNYTSGFVAMRTFNFLYGTVEFRVKFGGGMNTGSWPAVWMQDVSCQASDPTGTNDSCNGQEIDIAEILNGDFTHVNQQIHVNSFAHNEGCSPQVPDTSQNFHVYQMIWSPGSLIFRIDGATSCTINQSWVPNAPMYLKVDAAVGGTFAGPLNGGTLPWTTQLDYVRVTQGSTVVFNDDFGASAPRAPTDLHIFP